VFVPKNFVVREPDLMYKRAQTHTSNPVIYPEKF